MGSLLEYTTVLYHHDYCYHRMRFDNNTQIYDPIIYDKITYVDKLNLKTVND